MDDSRDGNKTIHRSTLPSDATNVPWWNTVEGAYVVLALIYFWTWDDVTCQGAL